MSRNTIVAIMLGIAWISLSAFAGMGIIEGDVYATSVTSLTGLATILIGIFSKDEKDGQ
jgi:hypothetical protein